MHGVAILVRKVFTNLFFYSFVFPPFRTHSTKNIGYLDTTNITPQFDELTFFIIHPNIFRRTRPERSFKPFYNLIPINFQLKIRGGSHCKVPRPDSLTIRRYVKIIAKILNFLRTYIRMLKLFCGQPP